MTLSLYLLLLLSHGGISRVSCHLKWDDLSKWTLYSWRVEEYTADNSKSPQLRAQLQNCKIFTLCALSRPALSFMLATEQSWALEQKNAPNSWWVSIVPEDEQGRKGDKEKWENRRNQSFWLWHWCVVAQLPPLIWSIAPSRNSSPSQMANRWQYGTWALP